MSWQGTVRSLNALAKAAERERVANNASQAVADWEEHIENLLTIHTDLSDALDWQSIVDKPQPSEPTPNTVHSDKAAKALNEYKASAFDFFVGGSQKRRSRLEQAVTKGSDRDKEIYSKAQTEYERAFADWGSDTKLAKQLLNGEALAIEEVIKEHQSLSKTELIGSSISFSIEDSFIHNHRCSHR